ncbi:hypothetical protein FAM18157_02915 [Lacticaseibacillus paracasei]|uniref:Uncharacterized protein n=1 Tax=Lacticaseibacillus paracasei TaxID=1597 RepID=A0A422LUJ5_LACPA|nr:hypothetical protein FAM18157_02915 [Lacticaseibacillus paracasei]
MILAGRLALMNFLTMFEHSSGLVKNHRWLALLPWQKILMQCLVLALSLLEPTWLSVSLTFGMKRPVTA